MLLITCPYCGPRAEIEFRAGGASHVARPGPHNVVSDEAWSRYLFFQGNPRGLFRERWLHDAGCGHWFNVVRDTATHRIFAAYPMGETGPRELLA